MTGREETDMKFKRKIENFLEKEGKVLRDYTYTFGEKTMSTQYSYLIAVKRFAEFSKENKIMSSLSYKDLKNIKPMHIEKYIAYLKDKGISDSLKATNYYALSNFFKFLKKNKYIKENPCIEVDAPKIRQTKEVVYMTPDEIQKIEKAIINQLPDEEDYEYEKRKKWITRDLLLFMLGCTTGLRVTSISEINLEDVDLEEMTINVIEKGNKSRKCFIGKKIAGLIKQWIIEREEILDGKKESALFISKHRKRCSSGVIRNMLCYHTRVIRKNITPHKMRSSCATNLYNKTNDIYLVQEILGHKNIANTKRYAKVEKENKQTAVNILENLFE